jgi:hypothetical protein
MTISKTTPKFAICINTDDPDLLTPRMVYEVLPDESAARSNFVRVIDNEGEDYCYPADFFVFVNFPADVNKTLKKVFPMGTGAGMKYKVRSSVHHVSEK